MTELRIAELYCHGFIDKEVADKVDKPIWTVRTHKKRIYRKLGISTQQELVLYMVTLYINAVFDIEAIKAYGLDAIFAKQIR